MAARSAAISAWLGGLNSLRMTSMGVAVPADRRNLTRRCIASALVVSEDLHRNWQHVHDTLYHRDRRIGVSPLGRRGLVLVRELVVPGRRPDRSDAPDYPGSGRCFHRQPTRRDALAKAERDAVTGRKAEGGAAKTGQQPGTGPERGGLERATPGLVAARDTIGREARRCAERDQARDTAHDRRHTGEAADTSADRNAGLHYATPVMLDLVQRPAERVEAAAALVRVLGRGVLSGPGTVETEPAAFVGVVGAGAARAALVWCDYPRATHHDRRRQRLEQRDVHVVGRAVVGRRVRPRPAGVIGTRLVRRPVLEELEAAARAAGDTWHCAGPVRERRRVISGVRVGVQVLRVIRVDQRIGRDECPVGRVVLAGPEVRQPGDRIGRAAYEPARAWPGWGGR